MANGIKGSDFSLNIVNTLSEDYFSKVPNDLIKSIFFELTAVRDLFTAARVCKRFYQLISEDQRLKKIKEAALSLPPEALLNYSGGLFQKAFLSEIAALQSLSLCFDHNNQKLQCIALKNQLVTCSFEQVRSNLTRAFSAQINTHIENIFSNLKNNHLSFAMNLVAQLPSSNSADAAEWTEFRERVNTWQWVSIAEQNNWQTAMIEICGSLQKVFDQRVKHLKACVHLLAQLQKAPSGYSLSQQERTMLKTLITHKAFNIHSQLPSTGNFSQQQAVDIAACVTPIFQDVQLQWPTAMQDVTTHFTNTQELQSAYATALTKPLMCSFLSKAYKEKPSLFDAVPVMVLNKIASMQTTSTEIAPAFFVWVRLSKNRTGRFSFRLMNQSDAIISYGLLQGPATTITNEFHCNLYLNPSTVSPGTYRLRVFFDVDISCYSEWFTVTDPTNPITTT